MSHPQTLECQVALNAFLFEVECTAINPTDGVMEVAPQELDSGTWFLVRVSNLPAPGTPGGLFPVTRDSVTPEQPPA